jgi:hypothetical protein
MPYGINILLTLLIPAGPALFFQALFELHLSTGMLTLFFFAGLFLLSFGVIEALRLAKSFLPVYWDELVLGYGLTKIEWDKVSGIGFDNTVHVDGLFGTAQDFNRYIRVEVNGKTKLRIPVYKKYRFARNVFNGETRDDYLQLFEFIEKRFGYEKGSLGAAFVRSGELEKTACVDKEVTPVWVGSIIGAFILAFLTIIYLLSEVYRWDDSYFRAILMLTLLIAMGIVKTEKKRDWKELARFRNFLTRLGQWIRTRQ